MPNFLTKTAAFTKQDSEKLRKDTLAIVRAAEKASSYKEVLKAKDATTHYRTYLDDLFYKKLAPLITDEYCNEQFRKATWDFYQELSLPLREPVIHDGKLFRSSEDSFQYWLTKDKPTWLQRVRKKARVAWKALDTYFLDRPGDKEMKLTKSTTESIEGFRVVMVGEMTPKRYSQIKNTLHVARTSLERVFPAVMKQKPIIFFEEMDIGRGGEYEYGRVVKINVRTALESDPRVGAQFVVHELGHDILRTYLGEDAKDYWSAAIKGDHGSIALSDIVKSWPDNMAEDDLFWVSTKIKGDPLLQIKLQMLTYHQNVNFPDRAAAEQALAKENTLYAVPKSPITPYAGKNSEESFCEAFSMYTIYGPRTVLPIVRLWLKTILPGANIITASFLQKARTHYRIKET